MRLKGKVALVTGAGQGIGRTTAVLFAKEGAKVAVADVDIRSGEETAKMIRKEGGESVFINADVSKADDARRMIETCIGKFGKLDVLFNNAGILKGGESNDTVTELTEQDWDRMMDVNVKGVFLGCKYAVPYMKKQGGGSIINAGSIAGIVARSGQLSYSASKGAVVNMTRQMALDLAKYKIRVNATCPGFINTPLIENLISSQPNSNEVRAVYESWHALGRFGTPKEVAYAVLYLASDESSFVTGSALIIDGGFTAGK